jgi:hypothetical protein
MIVGIVKLEIYQFVHIVQLLILELVLFQIDVIVNPDIKTFQFQYALFAIILAHNVLELLLINAKMIVFLQLQKEIQILRHYR